MPPAKLTRDEYETVQQHVPRGIEMLEPVGGALRRVIPIILSHHDKFDGSGYNSTSGESIPLESRIIAVADVYDALTVTTNPIPVKAALNLLGHDVGGLRLPLVEATDEEKATVRAGLERAGALATAAR